MIARKVLIHVVPDVCQEAAINIGEDRREDVIADVEKILNNFRHVISLDLDE